MMRWIIERSLSARRAAVAAALTLLVIGVVQVRHMRVDALPEFGPPIVEVDTEALGLSAPEVEQLITVPLEQDLLDGVAWLARIRSVSLPGLSHIEMIFERGTDLLRARQVVQERISQAAGLPNVSSLPQMIQPESSTSRVVMIGLSSDSVSPIEMSKLARWTIRPRLLGVPGVANVAIWGQRERQLQVQVDPRRLRAGGITLQQVIETTGNALWASPLTFLEANTPGTGGFVDTSNQRLAIQHLQPITTAADLARVPIEGQNGTRLADVARVVEDHQPLIGDAVLTGGPGLLLVVEKFPGANTVDVTNGVQDALDALRPGLTGIDVDPTIYRPASSIEASARNLATALIVGMILLVLGVGALVFDRRRVLITVTSVLLSLAAAVLVLRLFDATLNVMIVAGLVTALGVVVDDAIVGVGRLRDGPDDPGDGHRSVTNAIARTALEMRSAAIYATVVIAVVAVPLLLVHGRPGAFFPPLARSFLLAVASSMVVALTVTPAMSALLPSRSQHHPEPSVLPRRLRERYERLLARVVGAPRSVFVVLGATVAIGLAAVPFLERSTLPSFDDADMLIHWNAVPGTSLPEMDRITTRVSDELRTIPGVRNVAAHLGRAVTSDQAVGVGTGEIWVALDPSADHASTVTSIQSVIHGYPGIEARVATYPNERVEDVLSEPTRPVVVRVFGQKHAVLHQEAQEIGQLLSQVEGVVDPRIEDEPTQPTIDVRVDHARARRFGIKPGDVRRAAATVMSGMAVGSLFEEQKVFDVVVWGASRSRIGPSSVRDLLIDTPDGGHVRLSEVADVRVAPTPTVIQHEDVSRYLDVTADVSGRGVDDVVADVQRRLTGTRFPLEYHARVLDGFAAERAASRRLWEVAAAAAIGVFLVLQAAFRSWRLAAIAVVALLAGLSGGAVSALADGRVISIGSVAGFFAVGAVTVRAATALIRHYQHLNQDEAFPFGPELILRGSSDRFVPVVATGLTAALVMLPIILMAGAAGLEIVHPMAVVFVGGLATSVPLILFVVPALCARFGSGPRPDIFETQLPTNEPIVTVPDLETVGDGAHLSQAVEGS